MKPPQAGMNPDKFLDMGLSFWSSRVLMVAVEKGVFSELTKGPKTLEQLIAHFKWHPRASRDFFDALVAMQALDRSDDGKYSNSQEADLFLVRDKPSYIGGLLEFSSVRLYELWLKLENLLETGGCQAPEEQEGRDFFAELARDQPAFKNFMRGMTGLATPQAEVIAAKFPWGKFKTFVDVGAAEGALPVRVCLAHPHLTGVSYDLPPSQALFEEYVASFKLTDRLKFAKGDLREGPLPKTDVITLGHVLHGSSEEQRKTAIKKAFDALNPGGALLIYDAMVDPARRKNLTGMLSSLNIMLETVAGFEATTEQCSNWLKDAGFEKIVVEPVIGPNWMVYGFRPQ